MMSLTEIHAKECLRVLRRSKTPIDLGSLRAQVVMTDREGDKATAWLKGHGLAVFVRQTGSGGGWVATRNESESKEGT